MLEVGPTASLLGMGRRCLPDLQVLWLPSLRKGQEDWPSLLASLSELYVLGAKVDWPGFDRDYPRQRLSLPTYPFERERYWFEPSKSPRRSPAAGQGPVLHPLLGNRVPSALPTQLFAARLSCHWPKYLIDHQVQGSPVFPAAGYVEQALAAAEQVFGPGPHVLENLSIQQAMFLPEAIARAVQIAVSPESGGACSLETYSMPAEGEAEHARWSLHAAGAVRRGQDDSVCRRDRGRSGRGARPQRQDAHARRVLSGHHAQPRPGLRAGFPIDPKRVPHSGRCVGRSPLAARGAGRELAGYYLHPALGDAMFQSSSGMIPLEEDGSYSPYTYMPMGVRRVRVLGPPSERMYAYSVRRSLDRPPQPGIRRG